KHDQIAEFELNNISSSFEKYIKLCKFPPNEQIKLKEKLIQSIVEKEYNGFIADTTPEYLEKTVFLKHTYKSITEFPLFQKPKETKSERGWRFWKSNKKDEFNDIGDSFLKLPIILTRLDRSFKTDIHKEIRTALQKTYSFILK